MQPHLPIAAALAAVLIGGLAAADPGAPPADAVPAALNGGACAAYAAAVTPAKAAKATASATAAWNRIDAVSDGTAVYSGGQNDQVWGTWSANRPAQQWLQYEWSSPAALTGASLAFWNNNTSDTAGDDVAVPASWKLQAWVNGAWKDVALASGSSYARSKTATNTVKFASTVTTTRLRALLNATTNGTTYAAVAVSEFGVAGSASAATEAVRTAEFNLGVDRATGTVSGLGNATDGPECTNYVSNAKTNPEWDLDDSRWLGDVGLVVNGASHRTSLSDDSRTVSRSGDTVSVAYSGAASRQGGIRGFGLKEDFAVGGDVLDWNLKIDNPAGGQTLNISDLTLPMLANAKFDGDQTKIYQQNVVRHSFIAGDGSYVYWQRPNGEGPFLVMTPKTGTALEFRDKAKVGEGPYGEVDPVWEGLTEFAVHSATLQKNRAGKIEGYLPATSATVAPGASKTYGFQFRWADDYADLRNVLYDAGVVDAVSLPGMTIPQDTTAKLAVRAKGGIQSVTGQSGKGITVTSTGVKNGYSTYDVKLPTAGPNTVTVTFDGGRRSVLQYNSIAPIEGLIKQHAQFLVDKQQVKDPAKGSDGAFLQWDMSRKNLLTRDNYYGTDYLQQWMTGGSDDAGLAPAEFLSEQNALQPNQQQVQALDYYIQNFIWGYLQSQTENGQRTYRIYHWYDGGDGAEPATADGRATWRVMNFPHVWNTYLNMYRIAKEYPSITTKLTAKDYLLRAGRTMKAYFEHPNAGTLDDASREMGSMGESTIPEVIDALKAEGYTADANTLTGYMNAKADHMLSRQYPFASEMAIDTTAFESTYALAKRTGDADKARVTTRASLAARGMQPLWYYYGPDIRGMESWWNLSYETQLGAWQQQDYLRSYDAAAAGIDPTEAMRVTYGAYLAGWSNINSGQISADAANVGAAAWQYQSQGGIGEGPWTQMPMINRWWAWSGEADLGFWGGLRTASVNVVTDPVFGQYGYGADLTAGSTALTIVPKDGVRQRLTMYSKGRFGFELTDGKYTRAVVANDLSRVQLTLENVTSGTASPTVALRNLPSGTYGVTLNGQALADVTSNGSTATVSVASLAARTGELVITKRA